MPPQESPEMVRVELLHTRDDSDDDCACDSVGGASYCSRIFGFIFE